MRRRVPSDLALWFVLASTLLAVDLMLVVHVLHW